MKKVFLASMLAATCVSAAYSAAETPMTGAGTQAQAGPQLSQDEYTAYNAVVTATDPTAKAAAAEAFLTKYPQSTVKATILEQLLAAYAAANNVPKALDAADRLLQVDPNNIRALALQTNLLKAQGDAATDPATKQADYDKAASSAARGLKATKPAAVSDADWATIQKQVTPYFYSAEGIDALSKKDSAGAIAAYTAELKAVDPAQTAQPGPFLQDTFFLGQAYYIATPPDYLNCTYFTTRVAALAPDQFKSQFQPLASYCYKKYHGGDDGYDAVKTAATANLFPAPDFCGQHQARTHTRGPGNDRIQRRQGGRPDPGQDKHPGPRVCHRLRYGRPGGCRVCSPQGQGVKGTRQGGEHLRHHPYTGGV